MCDVRRPAATATAAAAAAGVGRSGAASGGQLQASGCKFALDTGYPPEVQQVGHRSTRSTPRVTREYLLSTWTGGAPEV